MWYHASIKKRKVYAFQRSYQEPPELAARSYDYKPYPEWKEHS